jgi:MFS family permease
MVGMLVVAAQLGTNLLVPRFGPKVLVPIGMLIGAGGMIWLTNLTLQSTYAPDVLLPLMVIGFAMGTIMPASMQTATLGVDRQYAGVASALVNTSQQVGGSIGTALLNTLAASAVTAYIVAHAPATPTVVGAAAIHSYQLVYWVSAGVFAGGAVMAGLLFRRRSQGLALHNAHQQAPSSAADSEPALAH